MQTVKENNTSRQAESSLDESFAPENDTLPKKTAEASANSSLDNMESLLVDEDEEDDAGLGTESLRMSGSEGEDGDNISSVRRKKRTQKILDSDDDEETYKGEENLNEERKEYMEGEPGEDESDHVADKLKKFSALIDFDSELEEPAEHETVQTKSRFSNLIDSDSEEKELDDEAEIKRSKKKKRAMEKRKKKSKVTKEKGSNSESEEESSISKKVSDLIDSDSESSTASDGGNEEDSQHQAGEEGEAATMRPKKQQRASAKKAMDEMQAIQSETQRLYRETQVSIPYHKPKRHTLKEFLTRRTLETPKLREGGTGKKLKMSPEELEEYAKHLEERAKEATEFFKSESEEELEDIGQDNGEPDKPIEENTSITAPETPVVEPMVIEESSEFHLAVETDEIDKLLEQAVPSQPTTQELLDIEMPQQNESETPSSPKPTPSTSKSSAAAKSLSELKKRLIAEKNLPAVPTLKGDPNMLIDFETGDMVPAKQTGLEALFQRFVKSNAHHKKKPKEGLSTGNDCLDIAKISGNVIEDPNKEKEPKPGAAYVKLKESLRTLITKKRREDFQKKLVENQEEEEEYNKCCGLDDSEEEELEKDDELKRRSKKTEKDIVIDDEENEIELNDEDEDEIENENENEEEACDNDDQIEEDFEPEVNDEIANDDEVEDDEDGDSESDEEQEENEDPSRRKHRVIKAFEDSDDEKDELDTGLNTTSTSVLYADEEKKNPEEVEMELLGLCSGQFEESQRAPIISQMPVTQTPGAVDDIELMELCSGVFNEEPRPKNAAEEKQKNTMKILSSDDEKEQEDEVELERKKVKKLTKKKIKRAKLGFSDDEDEEEEEADQPAEDSYEEEEEEIPQTFIDYDSEENEIEVQMSKKDCVKQANAFLEKEAELSESEWGSADEDEQNLDKYDIELGDEDKFDRDEIQAELGKIHMRKMLDDDVREVKKIQEMLFDNEEADGVGRQRQFRWKNIESGFSLDDPAGGGAGNDENIDSADDEEEMQWRKMRFEREQLLKQKTKEEILAEISATTLGRALLSTMEADIKTNIEYKETKLVAKKYKAPSFLIAQRETLRSSFLNYDKESLARIAETVAKSGLLNDDEQLQHKASKTGNFVFAPLSEEEHAIRKRKAEELENAKSGNVAKKTKINTKSLFLDKLL